MHINSYSFGRIEIDGKEYSSDVVISPKGIDASWWRESGHEVRVADLDPILEADPDTVIFGTGASGIMKVMPEARSALEECCDSLHVLQTPDAVDKYNRLSAEGGKRVVAALHLTC